MIDLLRRHRILLIEVLVAVIYFAIFVGHELHVVNAPVGVIALAVSTVALALHRVLPAVALALIWLLAFGLLTIGFNGSTPTLDIWAPVPVVLFSATFFGTRTTRWMGLLSGIAAWVAISIQSALSAFGGAWAFREAALWVSFFAPTAILSALALIGAPVLGFTLYAWRAHRGGRLAGRMSLDDFAQEAGLTPRETRILTLALDGLSNSEISATEHVTEATVKSQMTRVLAKTGAHDRHELAELARRRIDVPRRVPEPA